VSKQILINAAPWETRVALLEDTVLAELHLERRAERGIAGNVYKGRVTRVLPGMQAAFVDVGLKKAAFLHASDLAPPDELPIDLLPAAPAEGDEVLVVDAEEARPPRTRRPLLPIEERLAKGHEILVQIAKEPMGTKGARVTANVSLPGRHLVFMPGTRHIGISRRIEDPLERDRLRLAVEEERGSEGGFIVRTACEGATKKDIQDDVRFLTRLWAHMQKMADATVAPALVHQDLDVALRVVRDLFTGDVERVSIDATADYERVLAFVEATMPRLASHVHHYQGTTPLFEQHGVEKKIARALDQRVWLKSGGYLIFDQTESLTTVDVNTGRYVGKTNQEETVLRTNLEAAAQVMQQLRLRNIGGIIVIDFIDMEKPVNRRKVFEALQEALRVDKARSTVLEISELGLVQMTRKRTRESLEQILTTPCPTCQDSGRVRSVEMLAYDVLRQAQRLAALDGEASAFVLRVHPEVAAFLRELPAEGGIGALEELVGRRVSVDADPELERHECALQAAR
jgi:ribonuclease G